MKIRQRKFFVQAGITLTLTMSTLVSAADSGPAEKSTDTPNSKSADEIAAELSNPNTNLGTLNFFFDQVEYKGNLDGADGSSLTQISFQPGLPYPLTDTANLFVRPLIPVVIKQDVPSANGFEEVELELGDISFDVAVFNSWAGGWVFGGGLAGRLPTATDDAVGTDQWTLGPEFLGALMRPWGVLGLIVSHQWDVAGEDDFDTEITAGQYFYSFALKDGWQIAAGPTFSYNHEAKKGDEWTFPIGLGVNKTLIIDKTPWRVGVQYWHYTEQPDPFGPDYQIRLQVSPVVPLPW